MKKALLALALFVVGGISTAAQTCTPITVGKSYTTHDDGRGPNVSFVVNGTIHTNPTTNVYVPAGNVVIGSDMEWGYINVLAGFNGCTSFWSYEWEHRRDMIDFHTGTVLFSENWTGTGWTYCGRVPSCAFGPIFNPTGGGNRNVTLVKGHTYEIRDYFQAFLDTPGNPVSPVYTTPVYVVAQ